MVLISLLGEARRHQRVDFAPQMPKTAEQTFKRSFHAFNARQKEKNKPLMTEAQYRAAYKPTGDSRLTPDGRVKREVWHRTVDVDGDAIEQRFCGDCETWKIVEDMSRGGKKICYTCKLCFNNKLYEWRMQWAMQHAHPSTHPIDLKAMYIAYNGGLEWRNERVQSWWQHTPKHGFHCAWNRKPFSISDSRFHPSPDRIVPHSTRWNPNGVSGTYKASNIRWVSNAVNEMLSDYPDEFVDEMIIARVETIAYNINFSRESELVTMMAQLRVAMQHHSEAGSSAQHAEA